MPRFSLLKNVQNLLNAQDHIMSSYSKKCIQNLEMVTKCFTTLIHNQLQLKPNHTDLNYMLEVVEHSSQHRCDSEAVSLQSPTY